MQQIFSFGARYIISNAKEWNSDTSGQSGMGLTSGISIACPRKSWFCTYVSSHWMKSNFLPLAFAPLLASSFFNLTTVSLVKSMLLSCSKAGGWAKGLLLLEVLLVPLKNLFRSHSHNFVIKKHFSINFCKDGKAGQSHLTSGRSDDAHGPGYMFQLRLNLFFKIILQNYPMN